MNVKMCRSRETACHVLRDDKFAHVTPHVKRDRFGVCVNMRIWKRCGNLGISIVTFVFLHFDRLSAELLSFVLNGCHAFSAINSNVAPAAMWRFAYVGI